MNLKLTGIIKRRKKRVIQAIIIEKSKVPLEFLWFHLLQRQLLNSEREFLFWNVWKILNLIFPNNSEDDIITSNTHSFYLSIILNYISFIFYLSAIFSLTINCRNLVYLYKILHIQSLLFVFFFFCKMNYLDSSFSWQKWYLFLRSNIQTIRYLSFF